jgi:hypothetical protein
MAVKDRTYGLFARAQRMVDRVVEPDTRSRFYNSVNTFAHEQPIVAVCPYCAIFSYSFRSKYQQ